MNVSMEILGKIDYELHSGDCLTLTPTQTAKVASRAHELVPRAHTWFLFLMYSAITGLAVNVIGRLVQHLNLTFESGENKTTV